MLHEQNLAGGIKRGSLSPGNYIEMRRRATRVDPMIVLRDE